MTAVEQLSAANEDYRQRDHRSARDKRPALHLAVVTCMDTRLDLPESLGLAVGHAHFLRNAGGLVTPDVLRSLAISQRALGTREVAIVLHTDCGMLGFDDPGFRSRLAVETGRQPHWDVPGFADVEVAVHQAVHQVRTCPWLPHTDAVTGFVYDVATSGITAVA